MKTLGNILWHFPFFGFVNAILVYLLGLILTATVIAAPIGLGLMEFGKFLFAPFGHAMVSKSELNAEQNKAWKAYSTIVMILYFPFGIFLSIIAIVQVCLLFFSIIGIPVALVIAKSLGTYLNPINKKCVGGAVAAEIEKRKGQAEVEKYLDPNDDKKQAVSVSAQYDVNQHQSAEQSAPTQFADTATSSTSNWLMPAVAGGVILVLIAGGVIYFQKEQRKAELVAQQLQQQLAAEQERAREKEVTARKFAARVAQLEAENRARIEAENRARLEAENRARMAADTRARMAAENRARIQRQVQETRTRGTRSSRTQVVASNNYAPTPSPAVQPSRDQMLNLATNNGCFSCHSINKKVVGPAWLDVATKYRGMDWAVDRLVDKVRRGGAGVWGTMPEVPHPGMSQADIRALVKFILAM